MTIGIKYPILIIIFIMSITTFIAVETSGSEQEKLWYIYREYIEEINAPSSIDNLNLINVMENNSSADNFKNIYYARLEEGNKENYYGSKLNLIDYLKQNQPYLKDPYIDDILSNNSSKIFIVEDFIDNNQLQRRVYYDGTISCIAQYAHGSKLYNINYYEDSYLFARDYYTDGIYDLTNPGII